MWPGAVCSSHGKHRSLFLIVSLYKLGILTTPRRRWSTPCLGHLAILSSPTSKLLLITLPTFMGWLAGNVLILWWSKQPQVFPITGSLLSPELWQSTIPKITYQALFIFLKFDRASQIKAWKLLDSSHPKLKAFSVNLFFLNIYSHLELLCLFV